MSKIFTISSIVEGNVKGYAIVSPHPISFLGEVNPETGIITSPQNPINGKTISGKILVIPESRGSTVGSYVLLSLKENKKAPLAIVAYKAETIVTVGAILAEIPLVTVKNPEIISEIRNDDFLEIDTNRRTLTIITQ
ncbi:MAG: aconitase X swivel domain-containing protein [Candidatus Heimdallarchaeaceae archaeon]